VQFFCGFILHPAFAYWLKSWVRDAVRSDNVSQIFARGLDPSIHFELHASDDPTGFLASPLPHGPPRKGNMDSMKPTSSVSDAHPRRQAKTLPMSFCEQVTEAPSSSVHDKSGRRRPPGGGLLEPTRRGQRGNSIRGTLRGRSTSALLHLIQSLCVKEGRIRLFNDKGAVPEYAVLPDGSVLVSGPDSWDAPDP